MNVVLIFRKSFFFFLLLLAAGCRPGEETHIPTTPSTSAPTQTAPAILPSFTPAPTAVVPDTGWIPLAEGLERRMTNLFDDSLENIESLYILRVDPEVYQFGVAYHPQAQTLEAWQSESGALIVVNGGYFRREGESYLPAGLIVADGEPFGTSYGSYAGMFAVTTGGPQLRWLAEKPYDPAEPLLAAVQCYPLLVKPGGILGFPAQYEDNLRARRTVIGQDREGRILLLVASKGYFTLHELSVFLAAADYGLDIALNLDGGPSSGILLADPSEGVPAQISLPIVITVNRK